MSAKYEMETSRESKHADIRGYGARRAEVTASIKLHERPSACILWIFFDRESLSLGPFLWFGGPAGEKIPPLGNKIAKHTKPNSMLEQAREAGPSGRPETLIHRKTDRDLAAAAHFAAVQLSHPEIAKTG
jgi:hypothetical protein